MRKILTISLVLLSVFLFAQKEVTLIKATKQHWIGGQENSGSGTKYKITINTPHSSDILILDSVWIGEYYHEINNLILGDNTYSKNFKPGILSFDVDCRSSLRNDIMKIDSVEDYNKYPPPYKYKGEVLLKYRIKHISKFLFIKRIKYTIKYLEIKEVTKLGSITYP